MIEERQPAVEHTPEPSEPKGVGFEYLGGPPKPGKVEPKSGDRWGNSKLFKLFARAFITEPPIVNMPKVQYCPDCNANSKRTSRTVNGANYHCRTHGDFFVRAAEGKPQQS